MVSGKQLVESMRQTKAGWSDADFRRVLDAEPGYEFVRSANHGFLYRSMIIAQEHPDVEIRKQHAYVLIPKGKELKAYVADAVLASLDVHRAMKKER